MDHWIQARISRSGNMRGKSCWKEKNQEANRNVYSPALKQGYDHFEHERVFDFLSSTFIQRILNACRFISSLVVLFLLVIRNKT